MPLQDDRIDDLCLRWAGGHEQAGAFLANVCRWVRLADDLADGDSEQPVADMAQLLVRLLANHAGNPFYRDNAAYLNAATLNAILLWQKSEEWRGSHNRKTRMFGFVGREAIEHVAYAVAFLVGGLDHALKVAQEIQVLSHQQSAESFEDWEQE